MIQELLGSGGGLIGGERRTFPFNGAHHGLEATLPPISQTPSPCNSSSSTATVQAPTTNSTTTNTTKSASSTAENLRCPRCDSSNTKFCYYNNYNLTQPRHFCKTCRRYWTKGGSLRKVPIGGGCRRNRSLSGVPPSSGAKSSANNRIKSIACEIGSAGFSSGFDHIYELPASPIIWTTPHQNGSHLLSLLRNGESHNPNPSLALSSTSIKEEGGFMGALVPSNPTLGATGGALGTTGRALGFEQLAQNPLWRTNQHQQYGGGIMVDEQNAAFQQLYQRLRSSTGYSPDTSPSATVLANLAFSSSSSSSVLESAPVAAGDHLGFWNPSFSWSDHPATANGAYRN